MHRDDLSDGLAEGACRPQAALRTQYRTLAKDCFTAGRVPSTTTNPACDVAAHPLSDTAVFQANRQPAARR